MIKSWEDLDVWKKAHQLTLRICQLTKEFPREERYRLIDQLCRASASISTNIVEGKSRASIKEYIKFLSIAKGSTEEAKYLILLSKDLSYIDSKTYERLTQEYEEISKMLNGLIRSLRRKT